ncbi:hypothetical protein TrLO_g15055 [Triparma laevis f. longispina]|uniref:Uncharacterized protein n=1 Tax=Triparma laevis f. longispina TaxID=1714387 RepID=A0A9W7L0S2_9STRA|nr:hypothetical protein TrLO_g15055 [Triparma laevis f. longispina]
MSTPVANQTLLLKTEGTDAFLREGYILPARLKAGSEPLTDEKMKKAAVDWCTGGDARSKVTKTHGLMEDWDTSSVTDMKELSQCCYKPCSLSLF